MARRPAKAAAPARLSRDAAIARAVEAWFAANARDLPWRRTVGVVDGVPRRDPYHSLVSELMLQQTQVSRVVDRFREFIGRFPSVHDLAAAREEDVLALWSGLGYYRRARMLHAAARAIVSELGGVIPADPDALRALPGVGRYTAGAVASMALGVRTPVVDGNVARVLLRVEGGKGRTGDKAIEAWAWKRAAALVDAADQPGRFNEGLMELGAVVCTPSSPRCPACPLATLCAARASGKQDSIPGPRVQNPRTPLFCASVIVRDAAGRVAVERRPPEGMWAGLWQAPTRERTDRALTRRDIAQWLGAPGGMLERIGRFSHTTTHRDVRFDVWELKAGAAPGVVEFPATWEWVEREAIPALGLSSAQRRILSMGPPISRTTPVARV